MTSQKKLKVIFIPEYKPYSIKGWRRVEKGSENVTSFMDDPPVNLPDFANLLLKYGLLKLTIVIVNIT